MLQRMIGAAMFNAATYEEIEANRSVLGQAIGVVLLVTLCSVIGGIIAGLFAEVASTGIILGLVAGLVFGIVRWALWVTVLYLIGGRLLRTSDTETSWTELARVVGFAYTPGVLSLLVFVPVIGPLFAVVGFLWTLAAVVVAARQALDFESTRRAIGAVILSGVVGFIPWIIIVSIQEWMLGGPPA